MTIPRHHKASISKGDKMTLKVTQCFYKPPILCESWHVIHWMSGIHTPEKIEEYLTKKGLHPDEVYMDKGGSIWVPIEIKKGK